MKNDFKKSEKIFVKIKAEILSGNMKNITQFKKPPKIPGRIYFLNPYIETS